MKSFFKSNIIFTRKEQYGIIGILSLIFLILTTSVFIRNQPTIRLDKEEKRLNIAWQQLQQAQQHHEIEGGAPSTQSALFYFDPNSLDSIGFIQLGLSPKTTHYLLNWRQKGKHFYKKEDLKPLYSLSENEYKRLSPFIQIKAKEQQPFDHHYPQQKPLPDVLPLNQIDSATLVRLKGIGPYWAHKIIERRNALGGFLRHEQLLEIYKFPDSTYNYLKEKLTINPSEVEKIKLNSCEEQQLARHPYIGDRMAKNILLLRKGLNKYENVGQLRQVPLMNEEKYRKIAPYCTID